MSSDIRYFEYDSCLPRECSVTCESASRARIVADALKAPDCKPEEIWSEGVLIFSCRSNTAPPIQFLNSEMGTLLAPATQNDPLI
jgi:hypothetical protein